MTSWVPFVVLLPGSVSAVPVPVLMMEPKLLEDTWLIRHFWLAVPVHAATWALAPAWGPVTSRHLPLIRSVPSL
jgi:hypothetical protein